MKQVVVTRFGGPEVLELRDVPLPEPGPGQARLRVRAAGVNYADIMQREGLYPNGPKPPYPAGFEVAGVVDALGPGAGGWKEGDAVLAFCEGGYGEYALAQAARLMPKPPTLSFEQAVAVPCQYLTAYHALLTLGRLEAGRTVLLHAAAGGLGTLMAQIARNTGAVVIGTCGSEEKCALLRGLGCPHPVNYSAVDFAGAVMEITGGRGCDLIVETVGGDTLTRSLRCLKPRGTLITLGVAGKTPAMVNTVDLLANNWTVAGFHLTAYTADRAAMGRAFSDLNRWLAEDRLTVVARHTFPLERAAEAHRQISARGTVGKVVLTV